mmetsp:Transcript_16719/g.43373  ORF Transcript_16719/g.43373 Transcript_16719/m.43373 type:complete len:205 (-) Transcript_16719:437-1051(-)
MGKFAAHLTAQIFKAVALAFDTAMMKMAAHILHIPLMGPQSRSLASLSHCLKMGSRPMEQCVCRNAWHLICMGRHLFRQEILYSRTHGARLSKMRKTLEDFFAIQRGLLRTSRPSGQRLPGHLPWPEPRQIWQLQEHEGALDPLESIVSFWHGFQRCVCAAPFAVPREVESLHLRQIQRQERERLYQPPCCQARSYHQIRPRPR